MRRTRWERLELASAIANPAHYAEMIRGGSHSPTAQQNGKPPAMAAEPTGEVGGVNYHPPPNLAKLARVQGGFKVKDGSQIS